MGQDFISGKMTSKPGTIDNFFNYSLDLSYVFIRQLSSKSLLKFAG